MRRLRIPNPDLTKSEKTFLDADYTSGTALTVVNNYGFANDDIAIIGEMGEEQSESKDVVSQTGNTIVNISGAFKFPHNKGIVLYRYEYDQYEISRYRSGVWTIISTSNIQWDKRETLYVDSGGLSTDSYRYRLGNSASGAFSDYSPTIAGTGFTNRQVGYMISTIRRIIQDPERRVVSDDEILRQLIKAQDIIAAIREDWFFLKKTNNSITTLINTKTYGLNTYLSDLNYIDYIKFRYYDGSNDTTYLMNNITLLEMDAISQDNNATGDDYPRVYTISPPDSMDETGYIVLRRKIKTTGFGTFFIRYYKKMTELTSVASETDVPIPSILEDYALMYCYQVMGDEKRAKIYEERFYGPPPGRAEDFQVPTGIRLLELMQNKRGKAVGQPKSLLKWRGRQPMRRMFGQAIGSNDDYKERYF